MFLFLGTDSAASSRRGPRGKKNLKNHFYNYILAKKDTKKKGRGKKEKKEKLGLRIQSNFWKIDLRVLQFCRYYQFVERREANNVPINIVVTYLNRPRQYLPRPKKTLHFKFFSLLFHETLVLSLDPKKDQNIHLPKKAPQPPNVTYYVPFPRRRKRRGESVFFIIM